MEDDDKYSSGIFDFSKDSITTNLIIDDRILKDIIINLYYPKSPYDFSVLPIEILGKVYERFLGKTIRLTPSHKAKVEDKPEVKKAGGIFYTPEYIVDYIVKNTVGKLIKGKTPQQIEKIKILDSACGSGTFLVRAYSYILDYLLEYYMEHPERYKKLVYQTKKGHWFLTTEVRKHVLLNNIFGIDIDSQAVEVTKLSLLLKVLENETKEGVSQQLKLFNERALPSLDKNIKCGNSLVGHKFYYKKHITLSDDDKSKRINIFDWEDKEEGFGKIMDEGGFDIIIGNPPYIQIQKLKEFYPDEIDFIQNNYSTAKEKNIDIYLPFIEKGISLLKQKGYLGYICPNRFFNSEYGKNMRDYLKNYNIYHLVNFRHYFVFKNADAYTCLLFIQKDKQASSLTYKEVKDLYKTNDGRLQTLLNARKSQEHLIIDRIKPHFIKEDNWFFMTENESEILEKIKKNPIFSECYKENFQGLITGMDGVYILKLIKDKGKTKIFYSKELKKEVELESDLLFNIISDNNIDNYFVKDSDNFIIFPYEDGNLISSKDLEEKYPLIWKYLSNFKNKLKSRERNKFNNSKWYQYSRNQAIDKQRLTKILVPHIIKKMRSAYDDKGRYFIKNVGVNGICLKDSIEENPLYFLAILNSPISSFFISKISIFLSGGFYASNKQFAGKIPIKKIDFSNNEEKQDHDNIVNLVSSIIELNSKNNTMNNKEDLITRQINALYKNINNIIYKLYNITEQEKQIIEKS